MQYKTILSVILPIAAALTSGLIAGLLYAYSCSINKGLGALQDVEYVKAMQSINSAILNGLFFFSFIGALILLPVSCYWQYATGESKAFIWSLAATLIYAVGVFGVTMFGNVPLNEKLAAFKWEDASAELIHIQRMEFELSWNKLHTIRTVASVIAFTLQLIALKVGSKL